MFVGAGSHLRIMIFCRKAGVSAIHRPGTDIPHAATEILSLTQSSASRMRFDLAQTSRLRSRRPELDGHGEGVLRFADEQLIRYRRVMPAGDDAERSVIQQAGAGGA